MDTMSSIVWFPLILFIIHDFEEIIMAEVWYIRNRKKIDTFYPQNQPFGFNYINTFRTASIAIGIFCLFLLIFFICLFSLIFNNYFIWFGSVAGFFLGIIPHLRDLIKFKSYVPGILTWPIILIPNIWLLVKAHSLLQYSIGMILLSIVISFVLSTFLVFGVLHKKMASWSEWLYKYAQEQVKKNF